MHRFIAFAWNSQAANRTRLAAILSRRIEEQLPEWSCAFESPGLLVFRGGAIGASRVYELEHNGGVVLGKLFRVGKGADSAPTPVAFSVSESDNIRQSGGRLLVERYWGRYVAFVKAMHGQRLWVLRDPTGAVPCLHTSYHGINVICSHVADCAELGLIEPSINWEHVAAYLWFDHLVTAHTGLANVQQLYAGECVEIGPDDTRKAFYWRPDRIYRERCVESRQYAMRELGDVIQNCVAACASDYKNILHELSGGLDSAVVLACLSRAKGSGKILCENHFSNNADSDERFFARQAADLAEVELIETPIPVAGRSLDGMFDSARHATPAHLEFVPETQAARDEILKNHRIEAIFSGQGGDHYFQRARTPQIAAEFFRHHGLRPELLRIISDTSRFTGESIWAVVGAVINSGLLRRGQNPYEMLKASPLLSQSLRNTFDPNQIRHPWIDLAANLPGGKQLQIFNIIDSQMFHQLPDSHADIVHPLISQPIIELCLQIPSFVLTYGGIDHALVREAFAGIVPADILARTSKGATTGYFTDLLVRNITVLREFLLDGRLVSEGLLDKRVTDNALSERALIRDGDLLFPVLDAFRAEIWLRSWEGCTYRAPV